MENETERKVQNTQYVPTKCRVTKPVPPKPASNPMQFVAVKPSPLSIKAQEINKKVEVVKEARKEHKEEAEDWQSNLDNWKSSRRKRQEHIIERVEEVKKLELQEKERSNCRRGSTFSEILEKRNKGRFSIPIYDNDANDLSDYGIGSSSSKTNSIKDADTDDNSSGLDEKENLCDENTRSTTIVQIKGHRDDDIIGGAQPEEELPATEDGFGSTKLLCNEHYTYEGAIEDYRSRICTKINLNHSLLEVKLEPYRSKEFSEAQTLLPKGYLTERRKMFEARLNGSSEPKHVEEDLMNTQSIKERLQSFERSVEQPPLIAAIKTEDLLVGNLKSRLTQITAATAGAATACDSDTKNNNMEESKAELSKLRLTTSSSDLVAASSSDREDSGIHTTDVSCSVSQSDDVVEDSDLMQQEAPNFKTITASFLVGERQFAEQNCPQVEESRAINVPAFHPSDEKQDSIEVHSSLVENIAKTMSDVPIGYFEDGKILEIYDNTRDPFTIDGTDLLDSLASPRLQPPTEKPPPPPPLSQTNDDNANHINSLGMHTKNELLIGRSSFLSCEGASINELEIHKQRREVDGRHLLQHEQDLSRQLQCQAQDALSIYPNGLVRGGTRANEEIIKKEREIIEMIELEEKYRPSREVMASQKDSHSNDNTAKPSLEEMEPNDIYLGNKKFDEPFYPEDSEVTRVEQELLQLEQEELKRKRDTQLFRDRSAAKLQSSHTTYENMYFDIYAKNGSTRKSMPELSLADAMPESHTQSTQLADEWGRRSNVFNGSCAQPRQPVQLLPQLKQQQMNVPMIRSILRGDGDIIHPFVKPTYHRKSMPDLDRTMHSALKGNTVNTNLLMPIQPMYDLPKDRYKSPHSIEPGRSISRPGLPHQSNAKRLIQLKQRPQPKSYNEHWLYQEAELRRLADQQRIGCVQNRHMQVNPMDASLPYLSRPNPQTYANALPLSSYPQPSEDRDVILSVSGRKKCSYCCNELGRGAAMIIESLSLFYHMECFKCCVCHIQLGDGLMGTDVRVRNQKLHCHNCYSSDDGIKFSCV